MRDKLLPFDRRMEMLFMLVNRYRITRRELAEVFSVSDDTIDRDLIILTRYVPISITRGCAGGVEILNNYTGIIHKHLSQDEIDLLKKYQNNATEADKLILKRIIYKFSAPEARI